MQRRPRTILVLLEAGNCEFRQLLDKTPPKCAPQKHVINSADTNERGDIAKGKEADMTDVSPPNFEIILRGFKDLSEGDKDYQTQS